MDLNNHSMKEKILKWCLPGFYIIGILGAIIYGIDYYNEIQKQKERLLVIDKMLTLNEVGSKVQLELNNQNKEQEVVFEVDDSTVVKVDKSGELTSVGEGTTTVTVTNEENSKTQTFVVSVGKEAIEELKDYKEKVDELIEQNKVKLPSNNESSNQKNDVVLEKPEENQPQMPGVVKVTGVKLNKTSLTLTYNTTSQLTATVSPANATNKNVTWKSSDVSLVTVDKNGNIKAVGNKNALATITATTEDGKYKDTTLVTVKAVSTMVKVSGVNVSTEKITLKYGESYKINAEVLPANATNKKLTWTSKNSNLVTVDNQGNVTAKSGKVGITTIEVKTQDGGYSKKVDVVVVPTGNYISFNGSNYSPFVTDIVLDRSGAVMQSFAIYNNNIYISQQQSGTSGAYFSKIDKNIYDSGIRKFNKNVSILVDGGHAGNIDIEITNNVVYLWTGCSKEDEDTSSHCRIPLNNLVFGDRIKYYQENITFKKSGGSLISVDDINRTFVIMNGYWIYIYNLDDYLNGNARLINKFKVDSKSRQGFDVHGNYIYVYEGITAPILSIYTLSGERVDRQYITKPDSVNSWEAEGVKIYNNQIYIGLAKKADKKTANIYILN